MGLTAPQPITLLQTGDLVEGKSTIDRLWISIHDSSKVLDLTTGSTL
jgi:hypothetical protein